MKPDIARDAAYYRASDALRSRVAASMKDAARGESSRSHRHGLMLAASFATVALVSWNLALITFAPARDDDVAREVVAAHVRSLMSPGRLNDVESSDRHTVKPWFGGKIDFAPPVRDLADAGFPLAGGRLDYIDGRPVAALTYKRRLHTVNLFVWPAPGAPDSAPQPLSINGFAVMRWTQGSMRHWAVSDAAPAELAAFAQALTAPP
jgi:anti-sigma factor RsiW